MGIIAMAFQIYSFAIIIYILMSWLPGLQESKFGEILAKIVEPYLSIFRKIIPPIGMIDISPIVALLALNFIQMGLYQVLAYLL
ncbi:YggT family protein [Kurthia huakuii]|uniref:YggT family protein n=1 Tax=Kurthia huakuii TaxID=1421019 RepID=UPI0004B7FDD3|nr:YggT family protein [Kurthia huakuii]MBM7698404.1 YggT family protein [Kurthia huakuii]